MRRRRPEKRKSLPDPIFKDLVVAKFVNYLMWDGKKSVAEKIFYNSLDIIKQKESEGFSYDTALASFEILVRNYLGEIDEFYKLNKFKVTDERRWNAKGELITESEATVHLELNNEEKMTVGIGNGPVNAIDSALRKALISFYPSLELSLIHI